MIIHLKGSMPNLDTPTGHIVTGLFMLVLAITCEFLELSKAIQGVLIATGVQALQRSLAKSGDGQ